MPVNGPSLVLGRVVVAAFVQVVAVASRFTMRIGNLTLWAALLVGCHANVTHSPVDRKPLGLVSKIGVAPGAEVSDGVLEECKVESRLIEELVDEAGYYFILKLLPGPEGVALPVLVVRFVKVEAEGAGIVSGAKSVTLEGRLMKSGVVVGSFMAQRTTVNGLAGGFYRGTCTMVENVIEEMAEDIAGWLRWPTLGARLGEL
jgi:hypothetical protein